MLIIGAVIVHYFGWLVGMIGASVMLALGVIEHV